MPSKKRLMNSEKRRRLKNDLPLNTKKKVQRATDRIRVAPVISNPPDRAGDYVYPGSGYTDDEVEFMKALDKYKRDNRRPFPTCSEVLEVLFKLGYCKV